ALRAMITCAARPRLGAATMRLVLARESGEVVGLSLRLPGRSCAVEVDCTAPGARPVARLRVTPKSWQVALPLDFAPAECLIKVDWPAEQRLGLLDHAGWMSVPTPSRTSTDGDRPPLAPRPADASLDSP